MTIGMDYVTGPCPDSGDSSLSKDKSRKPASVNLKQVLDRPPSWWTTKAKAITILGVAHGIDYLHGQSIFHRDLKPSNILFDENMRPKICDFDIARSDDDSSATQTINAGTYLYMAPEVESGKYNHKVDYYSFGCILYEIFEGSEAFRPRPGRPRLTSETCDFTDKTPSEMQKIVRICLSEDEDDRCVILGDDGCLLTRLSTAVRENMGLNEGELEDVESYISELQCDDS